MFKGAHPTTEELFSHAESLLAGRVMLTSRVARHAVECDVCRDEIDSMCTSLEFVGDAEMLEPARDSRATVLLALKSIQTPAGARAVRNRPPSPIVKGVAIAACVLMAFSTLLHPSTAGTPSVDFPAAGIGQDVRQAGLSIEALSQLTTEEELLGAALSSPVWAPGSRWERAQLRALAELESDIEEALDALGNNPALARASSVISANRERKVVTLKDLYANRNL